MSTAAFNMDPAVPKHQEHSHDPATTAITELKTVFYDAFDQLVHVCYTQLDIELGRQPVDPPTNPQIMFSVFTR